MCTLLLPEKHTTVRRSNSSSLRRGELRQRQHLQSLLFRLGQGPPLAFLEEETAATYLLSQRDSDGSGNR